MSSEAFIRVKSARFGGLRAHGSGSAPRIVPQQGVSLKSVAETMAGVAYVLCRRVLGAQGVLGVPQPSRAQCCEVAWRSAGIDHVCQ